MKSKKKIFLALSVITNVGMLTSLVISCNNNGNDHSNAKYKIGYKYFDKKEDAIKYFLQSAEVINKNKYKDVYFANNNQYSNYFSLLNFASNHVKQIKASTYLSNEKIQNMLNFNGEIDENFLSNFRFDNVDKNIEVFRGKNNIAYETKEEAINSYFNINPIFKFNKKFYKTPEELSNEYLKFAKKIENDSSLTDDLSKIKELQKEFPIEESANAIFAFNNGVIENFYGDINNSNDENLKQIIRRNLNTYYKIDNNYYSIEQLKKNSSLLLKDLSKFNILKIQSNFGKKSFIVDASKEENFSLVGNYVHKSNSNQIMDFLNPTKWTKSDNFPTKLEYKIDEKNILVNAVADLIFKINNFNSIKKYLVEKEKNSVINLNFKSIESALNLENKNYQQAKEFLDEYFLKKPNIFKIFELSIHFYKFKNEMNKIIIDQTNKITLMDKFNEIINITEKGKKGSFLTQLPLIYIAGLSYLGNVNASSNAISAFINYIKEVNNFFNKKIKSLIGEEMFVKNNGQKIDLTKEFNFDGISVDTNMDINSYCGTISNSKVAYNAIKNLFYAFQNIINNSGCFEFDEKFYDIDVINNSKYKSTLKSLFDRFRIKGQFGAGDDSLFIKENDDIKIIKSNFGVNDSEEFKELVEFIENNIAVNQKLFLETKKEKIKFAIEKIRSSDINYSNERSAIVEFKIKLKSYFNKILDFSKVTNNSKVIKKVIETKKYFEDNNYLYNSETKKIFINFLTWISEEQNFNLFNNSRYIFDKKYSFNLNVLNSKNQSFLFWLNFLFKKKDLRSQSINNEGYYFFVTESKIFDVASKFTLGVAQYFFNALSLIFELGAEIIGKITDDSYVFYDSQEPNNLYVWDGGRTKNKLWGSIKESVNTIENAKILKPVQVDLANSKTYYLYNGIKYDEQNLSEIKDLVITDILKKNNNFEKYYSLNNLEDFINNTASNKQNTIEEAVDFWLYNNKYINFTSKNYSINNIHVSSSNFLNYYKTVNKEILKLKPIYFVQVPKKANDFYPIDQYNNVLITEIYNDFNKILKSLNDDPKSLFNNNNLVFFDSNYKLNNKYLENNEIFSKLKERFSKKINVKSKYCSKSNYLFTKKFDELSTQKEVILYYAVDNNFNKKYFWNFSDAFKELSKENYLNIKVKKQIESTEIIFRLNNQFFKNKQDLLEYIEKELRKYEIKKNN